MVNKTLDFISEHWRVLMYSALLIPLLWLLLFFRLGTPTNSPSSSEKNFITRGLNYKDLVNRPVQLPYRVLQASTAKVGNHSLSSRRAASGIVAVVIILSFFMLLKIWYTHRIAVIGTVLFATSSWLLHFAHLATPDITYALPIVTLASLAWLRHSDRPKLAFLAATASTTLLVYTPGMVWLVVAGLVLQRKELAKDVKQLPRLLVLGGFIGFCIGVLPLVIGILHSTSSLLSILGLPSMLPNFANILSNIWLVPVRLIIKGPNSPATWLGRLPYLNIFEAILVAFGGYVLFLQRRLERAKFIVGGLLIFGLLSSLTGPVNMLALLPYLMLLLVAGLTLLLQQWFTVFPRNPVARNIGVLVVVLTCILAIGYNLTNYFVAWPNAPETKVVFQQKI